MNILALDTSTDLCSVALWSNGELREEISDAARQHAALLMPMIDGLLASAALKPSELDGLVFGRGPGSFTGVRIATAAVQGISLATDTRVIGVSTLQALAHKANEVHGITHCIALLDARMQQVYAGTYQTTSGGNPVLTGEEQVLDPEQVENPASEMSEPWVAVGSGAEVYRDSLTRNGIDVLKAAGSITPLAGTLLHIALPGFAEGGGTDAADALPVYLRDRVALTEQERAVKVARDQSGT